MMQKSTHVLQALALLITLALTGCGGGGGGGSTTPATSTTGENSIAYKVLNAAPLDICPNGGITVDAGIDTNGNGQLDDAEIIPAKRQYVCNGADGSTGPTGPAGPAGPGITWEGVTTTSVQTVPNRGYMTNSPSQVTVTLPVSAAVGDIVRVSGIGAGGWKIAQNAGQSVITRDIDVWTPHGPTGNNWSSVASSADGTTLVATTDAATGRIFSSTDSGQSWNLQVNSFAKSWRATASSSDGTKLVALAFNDFIYTSTDSGATWAAKTNVGRQWTSVASSADGTKLVASADLDNIFTSIDSGATWTARDVARSWKAVASSADGTKLVAVVSGGQIFTSTDSGLNWSSANNSPVASWQAVASSSDGTKLVAVVSGGQIYTSTDSGVTWTPHNVFGLWQSVASSSDGTKLVAVEQSPGVGNIYLSSDSGQTWKSQGQFINWTAVASSSDGNAIVALEGFGGVIYAFRGATTTGTAGSITGSQYDALELQYVGGNLFNVLSHSGSLVVQ